MPEFVLLYTTWPDAEKAAAAGEAAIQARLAACVNIFAPIRSIYRWQGQLEQAQETPMTLKTTAEAAPALRRLLIEHHPYELPCILALPINPELSHPDFLAWIGVETAASTTPGVVRGIGTGG
jgi:periplasmic divalent cation tolerance protein